jgi:FMN hydrolase / 5-amino-6-(5-phospho-D-ribitylamino)uracil phosphatase
MLRAVCLDLMGTVVYDPYKEALEAATGVDLARLARLQNPESWPAFETARIDEDTFAARFFADPDGDHTFDLDEFNRVRREGYAWLPGMRALLDDLAGRVATYAASNYPVWVEELAAMFALDERFDRIYASHHLGVRKPDVAFYERLLAAVDLPADACLFVDDRAVNCDAAAEVGMRTHVFEGAEGLVRRLRDEGLGTVSAT